MFAYVIIAIELVILYTVFWYVFLREPRPYKIQGNPWGGYDGPRPQMKGFVQGFNMAGPAGNPHGSHKSDCGCQADQDPKSRSAIYEEWHTPSTSVPLTAGELIRSQSRGVERVVRDTQNGQGQGQQNGQCNQREQAKYAPHNPAEQYRSKYKTLPTYLTELGDKLNRINVKLP